MTVEWWEMLVAGGVIGLASLIGMKAAFEVGAKRERAAMNQMWGDTLQEIANEETNLAPVVFELVHRVMMKMRQDIARVEVTKQ